MTKVPIVNVLTDHVIETLIHNFPVNVMILTVVTVVLALTMTNHSAAYARTDTKTGKIEPICHVVCSIFKAVNSVFYNISVYNLIPSFTESIMTGCSISRSNDTLIYQTPNPYQNYDQCKAEFNCPKGYALKYEFTKFGIEGYSWSCYDDHLGI